MSVNQRIKEIRRTLNLSQREFAKAVYASNGYLAEIETGHIQPNDRFIHLVEKTFSVNKDWLLTGRGAMFKSADEDKLERMTNLFTELLPEFQDFVLKQIDQLIELQSASVKNGEKDAGNFHSLKKGES